MRRCRLHLDGGRYRGGDFRDPADGGADLLNAGNRIVRGSLDAGNLHADLFSRLRRLRRQCLDFLRDHGEAAAGLAGARRLDRGIERKQICLLGDVGDQLDHIADAAGGARQLGDPRVGLLRLRHRLERDARRLVHAGGDLADRAGQPLGGERNRLHIVSGLCRRRQHLAG